MKRAFLLVLLAAAPALAGGWPWRRCETNFQAEYTGFVDHWAPVVDSVNAARLCEPEHSPLIYQQQMALTYASPTVFGPQMPPASPRPAATTTPSGTSSRPGDTPPKPGATTPKPGDSTGAKPGPTAPAGSRGGSSGTSGPK